MERLTYVAPSNTVLSQFRGAQLRRLEVDFTVSGVVLEYRLLDEQQNVVQSTQLGTDLTAFDSFVNNAGTFPGNTAEAKLLALLPSLVNLIPGGGSVVLVSG